MRISIKDKPRSKEESEFSLSFRLLGPGTKFTDGLNSFSGQSVGNVQESLLASFHADFLSFITLAQYHKVDVWPRSWDPNFDEVGKGATGDVKQFLVDLKSQFAVKRFSAHRETRRRDLLLESGEPLVTQNNEKLFAAMICELVILSQIKIKRHAHIIDIEGIAFDMEDDDQNSPRLWPVLVIDKAHHGSLVRYMNSARPDEFNLFSRLRICAQIGSAISAIHSDSMSRYLTFLWLITADSSATRYYSRRYQASERPRV